MSRARILAVLTTIAILAPAIACALRYHGSGSQMVSLFLFAIPTIYGAWMGYRKRHYQRVWLISMLLLTLILGPAHSQRWLHNAERFSPGSACAVLLVDQILRSPSCPFISASLMWLPHSSLSR